MGIKQLVSENTKNNELNLTFSRLCDIRERPDRSLGGLAFDPFFPNNSQIHKLCHPTHLSSPQAMDRDWQKVRTAFGAESYPESSIEDSLRLQAIRGALREDTSRRLHSALYSVVENPIFSSRSKYHHILEPLVSLTPFWYSLRRTQSKLRSGGSSIGVPSRPTPPLGESNQRGRTEQHIREKC